MRIAGFVLSSLLAAAAFAVAQPTQAYTRVALYNFCGLKNCADGNLPAGIVAGNDGNIYGVTTAGGNQYNRGTVFKLVPLETGKWQHVVLYRFCTVAFTCPDGSEPVAAPIVDVNGNIYGTTLAGGNANGTMFELSPNKKGTKWKLKTVLDLPGANGTLAYAGQNLGQAYDGESSLYTIHNGAVIRLTHVQDVWSITTVYTFCQLANCADGSGASGDLAVDTAGNIFGTTPGGGAHGFGTVFEISRSGSTWKERVLHSFCEANQCFDGSGPAAGVTLDATGAVYGTTHWGGAKTEGALFRTSPQNLLHTVLYSFCSLSDCVDGRNTDAGSGLVIDSAGTIYGTTPIGGGHDVDQFKMGLGVTYHFSNGVMHTDYKFCGKTKCADGATPDGHIVLGPAGSLIGYTTKGGTHGDYGTIYMLKP